MKEILDLQQIIKDYNVPTPTTQYCRECGALLISSITSVRRHYFGKFNPETGKEWFIIKSEYTCPTNNKHFNEAGGKAVYWSNWHNSRKWAWDTAFQLTSMD